MKHLRSVAVSLALSTTLLFALPANVNAAKIKKLSATPTSLRGTWYHLHGKKEGYSKPFIEKIVIGKHSMIDSWQQTREHLKGKHFVVSYYRQAVKFKGYKTRQLNAYFMWNQGDVPAYMSTHLRVSGKYRHVMLQTPKNGPFPIFTTFKPTKSYTISGTYQY